jgi:hypothetical protein
MDTVAELVEALRKMPQELAPFMTDGDLPHTPVVSVSVQPADYGQLVLISRGPAPLLRYNP